MQQHHGQGGCWMERGEQMRWGHTGKVVDASCITMQLGMPGSSACQQQTTQGAPQLSTSAVLLVLGLELLAASAVERLPQLPGSLAALAHRSDVAAVLLTSCVLLRQQTRAVLQATSSSCLPPEVLQQAGLQLLQALAAPLQQLQLSGADDTSLHAALLDTADLAEQLYASKAAAEGLQQEFSEGTAAALLVVATSGLAPEGQQSAASAAGPPQEPSGGEHGQGLPPGQLRSLAAAHPEAYTALIDCCLRSPALKACDMLAAADPLSHATAAVMGSEAALSNTAAVAGLASALTSLAKRAARFTKAAVSMQGQPAAAAAAAGAHCVGWHQTAATAVACFPAAVRMIMQAVVDVCVPPLQCRGGLNICNGSSSGSSSSSSSQAAASAALLAVVLARSLVQLADAMEAAGPQLLFNSLLTKPLFCVKWVSGRGQECTRAVPHGNQQHASKQAQWLLWQLCVLRSAHGLSTLLHLTQSPAAAAAAAAVVGGGPAGGAATAAAASASRPGHSRAGGSSSSGSNTASVSGIGGSSSSSSSSKTWVKWGYLLQLQQSSPRWAAAVAAFDAKWPDCVTEVNAALAAAAQGSTSSTTTLELAVQP
ncbi:hypothetical protein COO60DRAFT_265702 [Scenedesmus sp. NREL 46B-D3]|nr:hypothetical protein COO60DRAFT_265702 [Scenedesmus sp. NREL 46B-D3]